MGRSCYGIGRWWKAGDLEIRDLSRCSLARSEDKTGLGKVEGGRDENGMFQVQGGLVGRDSLALMDSFAFDTIPVRPRTDDSRSSFHSLRVETFANDHCLRRDMCQVAACSILI